MAPRTVGAEAMAGTTRQRIDDRSVWRGDTINQDGSFEFQLTDGHRAELECALASVEARGLTVPEISRDTFELPGLAALLDRVTAELRDGRGFALVHGFPVDGHTEAELEKLYWGLCCHVGEGVTQNSEGGFIHYVTDGVRRPRQGTRGVGLPQETPLHVDLTDIVSLLCVRQAPDDPPSRVASSTQLYNEILRRRPDVLDRLFTGFEWGRMGEHGAGESASSGYRVPFFSQANRHVSCRYNRHWVVSLPEDAAYPIGDDELELFDFIDALVHEQCFEFPFRRGDIQFCNNYTVMHGRAAHGTVEDESHKRLLLRIWMNVPGFREFADEAVVRYGIGYHGRLGWTAADVLSGRNERPRARRADGALDLAVL